MTELQRYQLWIGLGIVLLILLFLIVVFIYLPNLTRDRRRILRILVPFASGAAGALITGEAVISYTQKIGGTELAVSGTAGMALYLLAFLRNPIEPETGPEPLPDGFNGNIPPGWTFRAMADKFAETRQCVVDYQGFKGKELKAILKSQSVTASTLSEALANLRLLTVEPGAIRPYSVSRDGSVIRLKV